MAFTSETEQEVEFLSRRVQQLRALQRTKKDVPGILTYLQGHIDQIEARISEVLNQRRAA